MGYSVYKIRNLINGKSYIGKSKNVKKRFQAHERGAYWYRNGKVSLISKAIAKYGLDNFEFEILKEFENPEEMNEYEMLMITEHNTVNPNGYNLRALVDDKYAVHEDTKKHLSDIGQGIRHAHKENILSEFIGVVPYKDKFRCFIRDNTVMKSKSFDSEIDAAKAYDKVMLYLFGKTAKLNFDDCRDDYLKEDLESFYNYFISRTVPKTSNYKGVSRYRKQDRWCVKLDRKRYNKIPKLSLPFFTTEKDAAEAYDKIMSLYYPNVKTNFDYIYSNFDLLSFIENHLYKEDSQHKGVCKNSRNDLWRAYVYDKNGKQLNLGSSFCSEDDAYNAILHYKRKNLITQQP